MRSSSSPLIGVGVVIWNESNEVVLIRRGKPPKLGEWSIPGGHLEWGETLTAAAIREAREETGLMIAINGLIDVVDLVDRDKSGVAIRHYVLVDFAAHALRRELCAGGDALEARWVPYSTIGDYFLWNETLRMIHVSAARR